MYELIVVDGLSVLFRSFYALKDIRNSKNQHIGGVYGFTKAILNLIEMYNPKYFVVALDTKEKSWRHELLTDYKSNRKPTPPDLIPQFTMMRDACKALGIVYYEGGGAEADDWIASCVHSYNQSNILIATSDKDLLQLVSDTVHVYDLGKRTIIKAEDVLSTWGVHPSQIGDLLALTGDCADCVGGVRGIGVKTAAKWLSEYTDLTGVLGNVDKLKPIARQNMLVLGMEQAIKAKELINLRNSLTVLPIAETRINPCIYSLKQFLEDSELYINRAELIMSPYIDQLRAQSG